MKSVMNRKYNSIVSRFSTVGIWEYNPVKDTILLCPNASNIYFGVYQQMEVAVEDVMEKLTIQSSQHLSKLLTSDISGEQIYYQQVYDRMMNTKLVMIIIMVQEDVVAGISIDLNSENCM